MRWLHFSLFAILISTLSLVTGCSSKNFEMANPQTIPDAKYKAALDWTDPERHDVPAEGSAAEQAMLQRFEQLFGNYTEDYLRANVTKVYAEELYFRDAFKQFDRAEQIRDYFVEGLAVLTAADFQFRRVIRSGDEFYIDWIMRLDFKKTPDGHWEETIGMTHIRFNSEGQVIFHQDYWDPTDIVYKRIPIARQLINFVKRRM